MLERPIQKGKAVAFPINDNFIDIAFDEKKVGYIIPNKGIYISWRDPQEHFFRKWAAWGVSEDILMLLDLLAIERIIIRTDKQDYFFYRTDFENSSLRRQEDEHDWQRFVSLLEEPPMPATQDWQMPVKYKKDLHDFKIRR